MHMEEGIGRSGYRVVASMFYGLGLLGLLIALDAFRPDGGYEWLVFGMAGASMTLLWILSWVAFSAPRKAKAQPKAKAAPKPAPVIVSRPAKPAASEFEYQPAAPRAPETLVLPSAFQEPSPDPTAWPERRGRRTTRGEMAKRYTQNAPVVREILAGSGATVSVPEILAMPGHRPVEGMGRGKCGSCGMMLLAPLERPVRLRCPGCGKGTLLH